MPRRFLSPSGYEVLVGIDAKENDSLSLRASRNNDYWFHANDCPGAHVILKKGPEQVPNKDIVWAAGIAVYYSKKRGPGKHNVLWARGADIRKVVAAPGTVECSSGKILRVVEARPCF
jgi:predicted ribosome quality control (RQC) complex YloA/Tae2 family protein